MQLEGSATASAPSINFSAQSKCPKRGETYRHLGDVTERHPVETNQYVDVRDGEAVLVLHAECQCGWSDETVLRGE